MARQANKESRLLYGVAFFVSRKGAKEQRRKEVSRNDATEQRRNDFFKL